MRSTLKKRDISGNLFTRESLAEVCSLTIEFSRIAVPEEVH